MSENTENNKGKLQPRVNLSDKRLNQFNSRISDACQTRIRYLSERLCRSQGEIIEMAVTPSSLVLGETWKEGEDWCTQLIDSVTKEIVAITFGATSNSSKVRAQQLIYKLL